MQNADSPNTPPPPTEESSEETWSLEADAGELIGDTGLRQVGEVTLSDMVVAKVAKENWLLLEEAGITAATIEDFGADFGIADLHELAVALAGVARAVEEVEPSECVHLWHGQALAADLDDGVRFYRVAALVRMLEEELGTEHPLWPITGVTQADQLLKVLRNYKTWIEEHEYGLAKETGAPPKRKQRAVADLFALAWPALTGEEPKSNQLKTDRSKSGHKPKHSRFYKAYACVCDMFNLEAPNSGTVYVWLKAEAESRLEVWREAQEDFARSCQPKKPSDPPDA